MCIYRTEHEHSGTQSFDNHSGSCTGRFADGCGARLNLTQPALSHSIRKIEQQLGVKIWRREGRSLVLTQAGEWLLSLANRLLPQFELAESHLEQFANGGRGTLRIGMECHPVISGF